MRVEISKTDVAVLPSHHLVQRRKLVFSLCPLIGFSLSLPGSPPCFSFFLDALPCPQHPHTQTVVSSKLKKREDPSLLIRARERSFCKDICINYHINFLSQGKLSKPKRLPAGKHLQDPAVGWGFRVSEVAMAVLERSLLMASAQVFSLIGC